MSTIIKLQNRIKELETALKRYQDEEAKKQLQVNQKLSKILSKNNNDDGNTAKFIINNDDNITDTDDICDDDDRSISNVGVSNLIVNTSSVF